MGHQEDPYGETPPSETNEEFEDFGPPPREFVEADLTRRSIEVSRRELALERKLLRDWEERLQRASNEFNESLETQQRDRFEAIERYQQDRSDFLKRQLSVICMAMSMIAFLAAGSDALTNFLPYASPEIWLGASLTLAGLGVGTNRKINPPSRTPPE